MASRGQEPQRPALPSVLGQQWSASRPCLWRKLAKQDGKGLSGRQEGSSRPGSRRSSSSRRSISSSSSKTCSR